MEERSELILSLKDAQRCANVFKDADEVSTMFRGVFSSLGFACNLMAAMLENGDKAELQVLGDVGSDLAEILRCTYSNFGFLFEKGEEEA